MSDAATDPVVVTGLGLCSPFGVGTRVFFDGLRAGRSCAAPIERFDTTGLRATHACLVPPEATRGLSPKYQRLPFAYQYGVVALEEALEGAGLDAETWTSERIGAFFGAPCNTALAETFQSALVERGPRFASPLTFEHTTAMAGPGLVSITHRITGPTVALPGGFAAGLQALHLASAALCSARVDAALVVAGDEVAPLYFRALCYLHLTALASRSATMTANRREGFMPGEGAAAIVLERQTTANARGARVLASVAGLGLGHDTRTREGDPPSSGICTAMRRAVGPGMSVDYLATTANGVPSIDRAEEAAVQCIWPAAARPTSHSIKALMGEPGAAGGLFNLAACLGAVTAEGAAGGRSINAAMANATSFGGGSASALVTRVS